MSLHKLVAAPPTGRIRPLLIDDTDYSTAVIRQGAPIPWTDTTRCAGHFGQVRGLLDPDALWIDVRRLLTAHTDARSDLVTAMGARTRPGYALRTLLGDDATLNATLDLLGTIATTTRRELVLHLPSPAVWLAWAHDVARTPLGVVDADRADSASMYIAEWLGRLGGLPVALVLLDVRGSTVSERANSYTSITNVVQHFDWSVAVWSGTEVDGAVTDPTVGVVSAEFWTNGAETPDAEVFVTTIPASSAPERVLDQLARLG